MVWPSASVALTVKEYCVSLAVTGNVPDITALYVLPLGFVVEPIVTPEGKAPDTTVVPIVTALSPVTSIFCE